MTVIRKHCTDVAFVKTQVILKMSSRLALWSAQKSFASLPTHVNCLIFHWREESWKKNQSALSDYPTSQVSATRVDKLIEKKSRWAWKRYGNIFHSARSFDYRKRLRFYASDKFRIQLLMEVKCSLRKNSRKSLQEEIIIEKLSFFTQNAFIWTLKLLMIWWDKWKKITNPLGKKFQDFVFVKFFHSTKTQEHAL